MKIDDYYISCTIELDNYYKKIRKLTMNGDHAKALACCNEAISKDINVEEKVIAYFIRANTHKNLKLYVEAVEDFKIIINLPTNNFNKGKAHYLMSVVYRAYLKKPKEALRECNKAFELITNEYDLLEIYIQRSTIYRMLGNESKRRKDYDEYMRLKPKYYTIPLKLSKNSTIAYVKKTKEWDKESQGNSISVLSTIYKVIKE